MSPTTQVPPRSTGELQRVISSGDLYRELFQHAGVAMAVLDRDGRIEQVNSEFRALIEHPRAALIGRFFWALACDGHSEALRGAFDGLAAGVNRLSADTVLPRLTHSALRCRLTVARLPDRHQVSSGALLTLTAPRHDRPDIGQSLRPIERAVLCQVAAGATTARVAADTHLSRQGVDYNLRTLMERFSAGNRAELVARAYSTGVLAEGHWPPRLACEAADMTTPRPQRSTA